MSFDRCDKFMDEVNTGTAMCRHNSFLEPWHSDVLVHTITSTVFTPHTLLISPLRTTRMTTTAGNVIGRGCSSAAKCVPVCSISNVPVWRRNPKRTGRAASAMRWCRPRTRRIGELNTSIGLLVGVLVFRCVWRKERILSICVWRKISVEKLVLGGKYW